MQVILSGEITVLQLDYEPSPGRSVYFEVTLTPYLNGNTSVFTTKSTGHGVGLVVCARIVENHLGAIEVESVLDKGTVFTLTFELE